MTLASWESCKSRLKDIGCVVDAHVHMGKMTDLGLDATPEFLVEMAEKSGISVMIVTSFLALWYDMEEGNRQVYEVTLRFPGKVYGYATLSSQRYGPVALRELERCLREYGFRGVKIYSYPEVSINERRTVDVLKVAADFGVPVLAHATPEECAGLSAKVPGVSLIMAHMGNTALARGDWNRAIMIAEECPNVYLDISGSPIDAGFVEEAVERVGADRLIFGSDMPLFDPRVQIAKVLDARITDSDRKLILGETISRLARLPGGCEGYEG